MPLDISKITVNPIRRTARSREQAIANREQRANLNVAANTASLGDAGAFFNAASQGLRQFFGDLATVNDIEREVQRKENLLAQRDAQARQVAKIEAAVRQDRKGALKAIETGDYSAFVDVEWLEDGTVLRAFEGSIGREMAYQDLQEFKELVDSTPLDGDPLAAVEQLLDDKLKGANDIFDGEYSSVIGDSMREYAQKWKEDRVVVLDQKNYERQIANVRMQLSDPEFPKTAAGLDAIISSTTPALGQFRPAIRAYQDAKNIVEGELIRAAAETGDPHLIALMNSKGTDGMSIADRHPGSYQAALQASQNESKVLYNGEATKEFESIQTAFVSRSQPLPTLLARMVELQRVNGASDQWQGLMSQLVSAQMEGAKDLQIQQALVSTGDVDNITEADYNKNVLAVTQTMLAGGLDNDQVNNFMNKIGSKGVGSKTQGLLSLNVHSQNPDTAVNTMNFVNQARIASNGLGLDKFLDKDAAQKTAAFITLTEDGNMDTASALEALRTQPGEDPGDPLFYFENQLRREGQDTSGAVATRNGRRRSNEVAAQVYEKLIDDLDVDADWADVESPIQRQYEDMVNLAAYRLRHTTPSQEQIVNMAESMLADSFEYRVDGDGNTRLAPNMTPDDARPLTVQEHKNIVGKFESLTSDTSFIGEAVGGTMPDRYTKSHLGYRVLARGADGVDRMQTFSLGQVQSTPRNAIPEQMMPFVEIMAEQNDLVTWKFKVPEGTEFDPATGIATVPLPPTENEVRMRGQVNSREPSAELFMLLDNNTRTMHIRGRMKPGQPLTIRDIDEKTYIKSSARPSNRRGRIHTGSSGTKPTSGTKPAPNPRARAAMAGRATVQAAKEVVDELMNTGSIDHAAATAATENLARASGEEQFLPDTLASSIEEAVKNTTERTSDWKYANGPQGRKTFMPAFQKFLFDNERNILYAYDDDKGDAPVFGPKKPGEGNRTIAHGFNMDADLDRAKRIIEQATPHKFKDVYEGRVKLSKLEAQRVTHLVMRDELNKLDADLAALELKKSDFTMNQRIALASMKYNHGGSIKPGMPVYEALSQRPIDHRAVAMAISQTWPKVKDKRQQDSLLARRRREADLYLAGSGLLRLSDEQINSIVRSLNGGKPSSN